MTTGGNHRLGNFQRRESFSRAARHDKFAPVSRFESSLDIGQRDGLVLAEFFLRLELYVLRTINFEIRPINWAFIEVLHAQPSDRRLLIVQSILRVLSPLVCRAN